MVDLHITIFNRFADNLNEFGISGNLAPIFGFLLPLDIINLIFLGENANFNRLFNIP